MDYWESVWYDVLYIYLIIGLGYYLKQGFSAYVERQRHPQLIGIMERNSTSIDHLFEDTGITRLD